MPLSINVGLSRKVSRDFQSTGVAINVTAELDQSLLAKRAELQQQIAGLYAQAQHAMQQQVEALGEPQPPARASSCTPARIARSAGANENGPSRNGGSMTASQRRAITAIARRIGVDPAVEARDFLGAELDTLTSRQASELIDHLKGVQPASSDRSGR